MPELSASAVVACSETSLKRGRGCDDRRGLRLGRATGLWHRRSVHECRRSRALRTRTIGIGIQKGSFYSIFRPVIALSTTTTVAALADAARTRLASCFQIADASFAVLSLALRSAADISCPAPLKSLALHACTVIVRLSSEQCAWSRSEFHSPCAHCRLRWWEAQLAHSADIRVQSRYRSTETGAASAVLGYGRNLRSLACRASLFCMGSISCFR